MKRKQGVWMFAVTMAGLGAVAASGAYGAAFALMEQSGSGMGNAFAGAAAVAEDASTVYFNPAGMSLLEGNQGVVAVHVINVSAEFKGTATNPLLLGGGSATGGTGGDPGDLAAVPNAYFAIPLGERLHLGLGVSVPFGLATKYDADWVGRFQGIKSELTTININPSLSYKVTDSISLGGGISYQHLSGELTSAAVVPRVPGPGVEEGLSTLDADDDGWGWNIGAMFQLVPSTRLGIAYRSEIDYELEGSATATGSSGVIPTSSGAARADLTMPDTFSLSVAHDTSERLQLLADVTRTGWSSIKQLNVVNPTNGTLRDVLPLDFDDAWRYSVGANYRVNDRWVVKGGLAFDETPVKGATTRTVRIPDSDRTWISIGGQWKLGRFSRLDLAYSHVFIKDADINHTRSQQAPGSTTPTPFPGTATTVTGSYEGSADIISVQYTAQF